jgi:hypothetical protein
MMVKGGWPRSVPVPVHGTHAIPRKLFQRILREAGLTPTQFFEKYMQI